MKNIDLDLDNENELVFKLSVEGTRAASVKSRFLIESRGFSLFFPAKATSRDEVSVFVPPLQNMLEEGEYDASLEVIVDDKVFTPMTLSTSFKKSVSVVAEVVERSSKPSGPTVSSVVSVNSKKLDLSETSDLSKREAQTVQTLEEKDQDLQESSPQNQRITKKRPRPEQRTRQRPRKNRMTVEARERKVLEKTIRDLSEVENANLSESQILKVVNYLKNRSKK